MSLFSLSLRIGVCVEIYQRESGPLEMAALGETEYLCPSEEQPADEWARLFPSALRTDIPQGLGLNALADGLPLARRTWVLNAKERVSQGGSISLPDPESLLITSPHFPRTVTDVTGTNGNPGQPPAPPG